MLHILIIYIKVIKCVCFYFYFYILLNEVFNDVISIEFLLYFSIWIQSFEIILTLFYDLSIVF